MKKKNIMVMTAIILVLGISGTCVACGSSEQKEQKQENTTEVEKEVGKVANSKKENEKIEDNAFSDSDMETVEVNAKDEDDNVVSDNKTNSNTNVNTENTSVTNTSSGNRTGNSNSASSSNNTGNSTGNSSIAPSGNSTNNSNSSTPVQPAHTHTWVHIDATGHYETVVIQAAWDEEVPVYENVAHDICNVCGADITTENVAQHEEKHMLAYEGGGHHTEWRYEQTGTQIVHHDAVTEQRWVQDSPAYDICSGCGAIK